MSEKDLPEQGQDLIYALDIGTRSVIGMLGVRDGDRVRILAVEKVFHTHRAMMDGQIEDIGAVAGAVQSVTARLEKVAGCRLHRACVAAAGRALRTEQGSSQQELAVPKPLDEADLARLEAAAVADAQQAIRSEEMEKGKLLLVGYTPVQYQLDGYPLTNLLGHSGRHIETRVVATFLPGGVIDSLYAVMRQAGLEVASLTLEPIAALNAAIPADLRLLNLCLVDIGAGTSDIAVCRDGSVVGYTMATVAGDEITETLMKEFLVDYATAEQIKSQLEQTEPIHFTDILGQQQSCSSQQVQNVLEPALQLLASEIAQRVLSVNGAAPSALFLAGGGSKLAGLREKVAEALEMEPRRVAIAGGHFKTSACSDVVELEDPEYTTPLGIAVSAGLGLISDSCHVTLNGTRAKLFRSGDLSAMDLLMMNGYSYFDLLGKIGLPLVLQIDGRRNVFYGQPSVPAQLKINGTEAQPSDLIHPGDVVDFVPARAGEDCRLTARELAEKLGTDLITVNGTPPDPQMPIPSGAFVVTARKKMDEQKDEKNSSAEDVSLTEEVPKDIRPVEETLEETGKDTDAANASQQVSFKVFLNGRPVVLAPKQDGAPYYVMDLLEHTGLDFKRLERPVILRVNGDECLFQQVLHPNDQVNIGYEDEVNMQ